MEFPKRCRAALAGALVWLGGAASGATPWVSEGFGPRGFLRNEGQWDRSIRYAAWVPGGVARLTDEGVSFLWRGGGVTTLRFVPAVEASRSGRATRWVESGCRGEAYHFFVGRDPGRWRRGVGSYDEVMWEDADSGVRLVWRWSARGLSYEVESSGSSELAFEAEEGRWEVDAGSGARLVTAWGEVRHGRARAGEPGGEIGTVGVRVEASGSRLRLVPERGGAVWVDPELVFATYLGGSFSADIPHTAEVLDNGDLIVAGISDSPDFPTTPGAYGQQPQGLDGFVVRLSSDGSHLVYGTFVGGSMDDEPLDVFVFPDESVAVCGTTHSSDFPLSSGAVDTVYAGFWEGFVLRLSAQGDALVYSTYLGGSDVDSPNGIGAVGQGRVVVVGRTESSDYPVTAGAFDTQFGGMDEVFVTELTPDGKGLVWSSFLGGSQGGEVGRAVRVAGNGEVVVAGWYGVGTCCAADFPVTPGAFQTTHAGQIDNFVTRFSSDGTTLVYSTFLGGPLGDHLFTMDLASGERPVVGGWSVMGFPTTPGSFQPVPTGTWNGYVARLSGDGSALEWSTNLGGFDLDEVTDLRVDAADVVHCAVCTGSCQMPTTPDGFQSTFPGTCGLSVSWYGKLSSDGSTLLYGTFFGGPPGPPLSGFATIPHGLGLTADMRVAIVGQTTDPQLPVTAGALDTQLDGVTDGFVAVFDGCGGKALSHGAGCPDGSGQAPSWQVEGCPGPGQTLTLSVTASPSATVGVLVLAQQTQGAAISPSCSLSIGPVFPAPVVVLPLQQGVFQASVTLPVSLPAALVQTQVVVFDPASSTGPAATNAVRLKIAP